MATDPMHLYNLNLNPSQDLAPIKTHTCVVGPERPKVPVTSDCVPHVVFTATSGNLQCRVHATPNISKRGLTMNIQQKELKLCEAAYPSQVSCRFHRSLGCSSPGSSACQLLHGHRRHCLSDMFRAVAWKGSSCVILATDTQGFSSPDSFSHLKSPKDADGRGRKCSSLK